jgi:hypothetical protein
MKGKRSQEKAHASASTFNAVPPPSHCRSLIALLHFCSYTVHTCSQSSLCVYLSLLLMFSYSLLFFCMYLNAPTGFADHRFCCYLGHKGMFLLFTVSFFDSDLAPSHSNTNHSPGRATNRMTCDSIDARVGVNGINNSIASTACVCVCVCVCAC